MPPKGYVRGYQPVLPLDAIILSKLPDEGTMFAGFYMEGLSGKDIAQMLGEGVDTAIVQTRLRVLKFFGLTVTHRRPKQAGLIHQATAKGREFQREHLPDEGVT